MVVVVHESYLDRESFLQMMTPMNHSHSPTSLQAAVREEVVEEAYQVPNHSLATNLAIDWRALTSLHYSQWHLQRQLVGMRVVSPIAPQTAQVHCFATPAMVKVDRTLPVVLGTASL